MGLLATTVPVAAAAPALADGAAVVEPYAEIAEAGHADGLIKEQAAIETPTSGSLAEVMQAARQAWLGARGAVTPLPMMIASLQPGPDRNRA